MSHLHPPGLPPSASDAERRARYGEIHAALDALLDGQTDWIAAAATVVCELHHAFDFFHWTGIYRVQGEGARALIIGPYQGTHGCLHIDFSRGVCGAAARTGQTIRLDDVHQFPDHIACSSTTISELVVPILGPDRRLIGVLDVDSDLPGAFHAVDAEEVARICQMLGARFAEAAPGVTIDAG